MVMMAVLLTSMPVYAAAPGDNNKPVNATNIEIVKKVTLKGPAAKGGKTAAFAAAGTLGDPLPSGGKKYAIVIGINDYYGDSSDLQYCVNDANLVASVLTNTYHFDTVDTVTDKSATYGGIKGKILALAAQVSVKDEVVFFFSGHGAKGKAADYDNNNIDQSIVVNNDANTGFAFIWDGELVKWFSGYPTNRIIFVFDSCLAGGMAVLRTDGRVVCMGSTINSMSLEGSQWDDHGQFTYYFAKQGMEQGLADTYDNLPRVSDVTVEEAFDYASTNCKNQTPTIADGFTNDLLP